MVYERLLFSKKGFKSLSPVDVLGFVLGAAWGSFFNVSYSRFLKNQNVLNPARSYCDVCGQKLRWWHNIPVISYLILRGKCAFCGSPIPTQYFLFELFWSFFWGWIIYQYGWTWQSLWLGIWGSGLIWLAIVDAYTFLIPDFVLLWVGIIGITVSLAQESVWQLGWRLLAASMSYFTLWFMNFLYRLIRNMDGMGGGDFKLMAIIGFQVGFMGTWVTLILASLTGAIYGLWSIWRKKQDLRYPIPFGPFLVFGAMVYELGLDLMMSLFDRVTWR